MEELVDVALDLRKMGCLRDHRELGLTGRREFRQPGLFAGWTDIGVRVL